MTPRFSKTHLGLVLLALVILLSVCCTQSTEAEKSFSPASPIAFDLIDGIDDGFEGYDYLELKMTQGTADTVQLVYKPQDQSSQSVTFASSDGINFSANVLFGPYKTEWFINAASSTGATTDYGSSSAMITSQKYLNKSSADQMLFNILNEKLSASEVITYEPKSVGNTHTIQVLINSVSTNVDVDHFVDIPTFETQYAQRHQEYVIEYYHALGNNNQPLTGSANTTSTYQQVASEQTRDLGYIIIASTDEGSMELILSNPSFFKNRVFLSELTGDNLQLIQY